MLTKEQAIALRHRDTLTHDTATNRDGTPLRVRVNGKCKTWKTRPDDFCVPVKHGLKTSFYVTQFTQAHWTRV